MFVKEKIMYHIHKKDNYDDLWSIGKFINNSGDEFINNFYEQSLLFKPAINFNNEPSNIADVLEFFSNKEEPLDDKFVKMLLKDAKKFFVEYEIYKRELILEEIRSKFYPGLPSRKNCIFLCDDKGLEEWVKEFKLGFVIYKVKVTGELFRSSSYYIPNALDDYYESVEWAHKYWMGNRTEKGKTEYLFIGNLEIVEGIGDKK